MNSFMRKGSTSALLRLGLMPRWLKMIALGAYVVVILLLSLLPGSDLPKVKLFPHADKLVHCGLYAGFTFLLFWVWPRFFRGNRRWLPLFVVISWGGLMEVLQYLGHYGRSFDLMDVVANTIGFFPGLMAWMYGDGWLRRHQKEPVGGVDPIE